MVVSMAPSTFSQVDKTGHRFLLGWGGASLKMMEFPEWHWTRIAGGDSAVELVDPQNHSNWRNHTNKRLPIWTKFVDLQVALAPRTRKIPSLDMVIYERSWLACEVVFATTCWSQVTSPVALTVNCLWFVGSGCVLCFVLYVSCVAILILFFVCG